MPLSILFSDLTWFAMLGGGLPALYRAHVLFTLYFFQLSGPQDFQVSFK